jgi:hypothetical protein
MYVYAGHPFSNMEVLVRYMAEKRKKERGSTPDATNLLSAAEQDKGGNIASSATRTNLLLQRYIRKRWNFIQPGSSTRSREIGETTHISTRIRFLDSSAAPDHGTSRTPLFAASCNAVRNHLHSSSRPLQAKIFCYLKMYQMPHSPRQSDGLQSAHHHKSKNRLVAGTSSLSMIIEYPQRTKGLEKGGTPWSKRRTSHYKG